MERIEKFLDVSTSFLLIGFPAIGLFIILIYTIFGGLFIDHWKGSLGCVFIISLLGCIYCQDKKREKHARIYG